MKYFSLGVLSVSIAYLIFVHISTSKKITSINIVKDSTTKYERLVACSYKCGKFDSVNYYCRIANHWIDSFDYLSLGRKQTNAISLDSNARRFKCECDDSIAVDSFMRTGPMNNDSVLIYDNVDGGIGASRPASNAHVRKMNGRYLVIDSLVNDLAGGVHNYDRGLSFDSIKGQAVIGTASVDTSPIIMNYSQFIRSGVELYKTREDGHMWVVVFSDSGRLIGVRDSVGKWDIKDTMGVINWLARGDSIESHWLDIWRLRYEIMGDVYNARVYLDEGHWDDKKAVDRYDSGWIKLLKSQKINK